MTIDAWPPAPDLRRTDISFNFRDNNYLGHLVAPPESSGPRPLVLIIHNYQGLKFFDVDVAEYLARVGYVGLAVDMYGDIVPAEERTWPVDANAVDAFQNKCFQGMVACDHDHAFFRALLSEWLQKGLAHPAVDASVSPAAWGVTRPPLKRCHNQYNTSTIVLIENGKDDSLVPDASRQTFYEEMDDAGVHWIFHDHAKTPHGFALPTTLGPPGHLHEGTDRRSTLAMLDLFREIFPNVKQQPVTHNAAGTLIPC